MTFGHLRYCPTQFLVHPLDAVDIACGVPQPVPGKECAPNKYQDVLPTLFSQLVRDFLQVRTNLVTAQRLVNTWQRRAPATGWCAPKSTHEPLVPAGWTH
jgi:hypothetical protein